VVTGDEGRPITDFTHRLDYPDLVRDAGRVLSNLAPNERTIRTQEGEWLLMRMRPYRTIDDRIDGVVLTLVDVTERHDSEQRWGARQRELGGEFRRRLDSAMELMSGVIAHVLDGAADGAQAQAAVAGRIAAIRRTDDLIPGSAVGATELGAVARSELAASLGPSVSRVRLQGPPVALAGDVAMRVGLLLHELAANALSVGVLSRSEGRVSLRWETIEGKRGKRVEMVWTESGDLPARQANDSGAVLPEFGVPGVSVRREFRPDRRVYAIELPLRSRADDGTGEGPTH
jgi:two-component system CheB/CheR fusion protein